MPVFRQQIAHSKDIDMTSFILFSVLHEQKEKVAMSQRFLIYRLGKKTIIDMLSI